MKHQSWFDQLESKELEQAFKDPAPAELEVVQQNSETDGAIKKFLNKQNDDATSKEERKVPEEEQ